MEELDGQYAEIEGRGLVTFVRSYETGAGDLWEAVATADGLDGWFPSRVALDPDAGLVSFSGDPNAEPSSGRILDWEPPNRWAFAWGGDLMELVVEGTDAAAELTLRNWLADSATAARNAAGWHVCLGELEKRLGGSRSSGPSAGGPDAGAAEDSLDWRTLYDGYVAAGLPSGAPIPGQTP
ncbi:hypothetical protein SA2016_0050 [Sinomonas atrocyanea]|uniref:SRPBCC family protein n=1 Tax=Sinomonas atrocyanea TaxID=37927 RepID=A0A126ZWE9_9MICC|nr:hypothetical protein [Sinomonas atrocyanea]AMM30755.1 hypothetical protein SA2016_0050 [Sinomonas atrocyanea]GEB63801.1 hypothetical protein SAT01_12490 [Sinomonas atrocyanea]GGG64985.1 hypothetical protein GCM10007172_15520 [Sinomonas atrocyanea]